MKSLARVAILGGIALLIAALLTACHPTFVVLPAAEGDSLRDTVRAGMGAPPTTRIIVDTVLRVDTVKVPSGVITRVDTVVRHDTVVRVDTLRVPGAPGSGRIPTRVDTVLRLDTVIRMDTVVRVDTLTVTRIRTETRVDTVIRVDTVVRTDTVRAPPNPGPRRGNTPRVDTVVRVDTVRITAPPNPRRGNPGRGPTTDTVIRVHTDTVIRTDTVRVTVTDTVRVEVPGRRLLFVPPGQFPPEGRCRVWIHGTPPGRQAPPAPCNRLGRIPAGAFVLFAGEAWDFDYDWVAAAAREPGSVPPEIVALQRGGRR